MKKQQHHSARGRRAGIHLACTALRRVEQAIAQRRGDASSPVPAAAVDHDHLDAVPAYGLQRKQRRRERVGLVEHGDDD